MEMLIPNGDTQLYTQAYPNSGKETVILLHGGPGVPGGLTFLLHYLNRNYQVIYFHQRGTLKSPTASNDFSMESYVSDINRIADHFDLRQFHLFGHSWGGLYAQIFAQQHPDRLQSLFLCSPAAGTGKQWAKTGLEITEYNKAKCSLLTWLGMQVSTGLGVLGIDRGYKLYFQQALANFSRGFTEAHPEHFDLDSIKAKAINRTAVQILRYELMSEMPNPGFPITIAYGDQDIIGKSRKYVRKRFPSANFFTIPSSGHIPWSHNQKAFVQVLEQHYQP